MKTEKLSFKSIKNAMSRSEMRKVMAGSGPGGGGSGGACSTTTCGFIMGVPGNPSCCIGLHCYFNTSGYNYCAL
ncbi:hypothetical protein BH09BAC6_BH09BAC6_01130 [soil metagenome]|jgi:hypothetical protein